MRSMIVVVGLGLVGMACSRQVGTASVTSAAAPTRNAPNDDAALRIADELCSRATSCREIGDGARYRSDEACLSDQGVRARTQASQWTCTPSQDSVAHCLAAIRGEKCGTLLSKVDDIEQCRSRAVCAQP